MVVSSLKNFVLETQENCRKVVDKVLVVSCTVWLVWFMFVCVANLQEMFIIEIRVIGFVGTVEAEFGGKNNL